MRLVFIAARLLCITGLFLLFLFPSAAQNVSGRRVQVNHRNATATIDLLNKKATQQLQLDLDSALSSAMQAYRLAQQFSYKRGEWQALVNMGSFYQTRGKYNLSIDSYLKVVNGLPMQNDTLAGVALLGLAQIYKDLSSDVTDDYIDKALNYSRTAYALFSRLKDTVGIKNSLSMQGILFRDKASLVHPSYFDSALAVFTKAIELDKLSNKGYGLLPKLYNNISQVYIEHHHDYHKGLDYLNKAVQENKKINSVWGLTHNYGNMSNAYLKLGDYPKGIEYARKMLQASITIQRPVRVYNSYKVLSTAFESARQYDSALAYYKLATNLNDSLSDIKKTEQVVELETKYETAKKESEIQNLNTQNNVQNSRILALAVSLVVLVAIFVGFVWLYRRLQKQRHKLDVQSKQLELAFVQTQQQKVRLEEVVAVKDKLFSVISHDLRTPVNTLISFSELLQHDRVPPEKLKGYFQVLQKTLSKTADLMNNLLHWAASQMRGFQPVIQPTSVHDIAQRAISDLQQQAALKQVTVTSHICNQHTVLADAEMLTVVLRNLISNAIKFVDPVSGKVTIEAVAENEIAKILVHDNGIGMSQSQLTTFNDPGQVTSVKTTAGTAKEAGTGLGLMLCKSLINQMDGSIEASSDPSGGTTFTITLPVSNSMSFTAQ